MAAVLPLSRACRRGRSGVGGVVALIQKLDWVAESAHRAEDVVHALTVLHLGFELVHDESA